MTKTVLILGGNGKIGSHSADAFWNAGWDVRHYDRASNDMTKAAAGVDVIVNGLNPPAYDNWQKNIPKITSQVIAAAKASGATVIVPGNIYNYGNCPGILDENTPQVAHTIKGKVRIAMEQRYRDAGIPTIILRAGNFIDPNGNGDFMSLVMLRDIKRDKVTSLGDPKAMQAYAYVPDWARAAVELAEMRKDLPAFADIPFPGHSFSTLDLRESLSAILGRSLKIVRFPWWFMTLAAPFWTLASEMREMRYLSDMPHQISGERLAQLLPGFVATPMETVAANCLPADLNPNQAMRSGQQPVLAK